MAQDAVPDVVPDLVPARMLNAYAYCPRLFFLEWVDRLWAANADVAEGLRTHRRVDSGGGAAPAPEDDEELIAARSVDLASDLLGITATLDLVEGDGGTVVPVDTKKGSPARDGTAWEADQIQVCAQILLLRAHRYRCEHGELYYAGVRRRIPVLPTDTLVAHTYAVLEEARVTAAKLRPPPPLQASPKCPRCSLVGICLPDEVNMLTGRQDTTPRRLVAPDSPARPLYVTEQGATVGIDGGRVAVTKQREQLTTVRTIDVSHLCLYGNIQVTAQALRTFFAKNVGVFHFSYGGWLSGVSTGLPSKNVQLRVRQNTAAARGELDHARRMIAGKIRNCRVLLRRNGGPQVSRAASQLGELANRAADADSAGTLLGVEGAAARLYFEAFPTLVPTAERLPGPVYTGLRTRRPPTDAVNCILSFCYGLLTKELVAACLAVGFDPYIGLYHRPRFGRPALALDLAEEFRPLLADSTTIRLINQQELGENDFTVRAGAVSLTQSGRKKVIRAWERRMATELRHPQFGYSVTYRRAVDLQVRLLAACLVGELDRYEPLVTR